MNAYFEDFSNVRYNEHIRTGEASTRQIGDGLISLICAIIAFITCPAAVKIEKTLVVLSLVIAFVGVIGGMESGTLSTFWGIILSACICFVEYATLKSMFKPMREN